MLPAALEVKGWDSWGNEAPTLPKDSKENSQDDDRRGGNSTKPVVTTLHWTDNSNGAEAAAGDDKKYVIRWGVSISIFGGPSGSETYFEVFLKPAGARDEGHRIAKCKAESERVCIS
jgi:hypothetical protein